ncbi:MAG: SDR family oxidoreductase [Anaerolineales bacterium]|jgi:NAD(P)-dependent dehydrogenase (short-subunit alcohol dehydrogenase family)
MNQLKGKVEVITGASRGLGLAIARLYAQERAQVVLSGRSQPVIAEASRAWNQEGLQTAAFACDVSDRKQVEALADFAIRTYGHFDVWVNNAGIGGPFGPTLDLSVDDFRSVLQTNIFGTYYGSVTAMRHFLPRGSGKLINLLGAGERGPVPNQNAYASTKSWIRVFTLALAREYKTSGVGVFAFQPGLMETDLLKEVRTFEGYEPRLSSFMPFLIRAIGKQPELPARKALWLASPATDGRTGLSVKTGSPFSVPGGFLREGLRHLLRLPERRVEMHIQILPSAFTPLDGDSPRKS